MLSKIFTNLTLKDWLIIVSVIIAILFSINYFMSSSGYKKEIKKLGILDYIQNYTPNHYLVPITSKLKSLLLKPRLLGMNPVEVKPERLINQTAII